MGGGTGGGGFGNTYGSKTTQHGYERLSERGFSKNDVLNTKKSKDIRYQQDGAKVYINKNENGKFDVIIEGARGIITALKNISQKSLDRLAKNYNWRK